MSRTDRSLETESRAGVGVGTVEGCLQGAQGFFGDDKNTLKLVALMVTQFYELTKSH